MAETASAPAGPCAGAPSGAVESVFTVPVFRSNWYTSATKPLGAPVPPVAVYVNQRPSRLRVGAALSSWNSGGSTVAPVGRSYTATRRPSVVHGVYAAPVSPLPSSGRSPAPVVP